MGHKPWDRPWKRVEKAKARRAWQAEVIIEAADRYEADVPMSADVLAAHLRPMAAGGNPLAAAYLSAIEGAPNPEAAARAVEWSIGQLFDSLKEILDALVVHDYAGTEVCQTHQSADCPRILPPPSR